MSHEVPRDYHEGPTAAVCGSDHAQINFSTTTKVVITDLPVAIVPLLQITIPNDMLTKPLHDKLLQS